VHTAPSLAPRQSVARTALAGIIGNVLEWFDFAVYNVFVAAIGAQFFPASNPTVQTLTAYAGFAIGFFGRPVGSLVLGAVGDRVGRRTLLTLSVALMGGATLAIGLLPSYATIGIAAPIFLLILRFIQGFAVGGEFTGSMVYTTELSSPFWRGLVSSSTAAGTTIGIMLGNVAALILQAVLTTEQQNAWGWRIPFIASVVFCLVGWLLRRGIHETAEGEKAVQVRAPIAASLVRDWRPILQTFGIVAMTNAAYYLTFTFAAERRAHMGKGNATFWAANLLGLSVVLLAKPFGGWLSDRIGRRRLMLVLTVIGMAVIFIALPHLLEGSAWDFWYAQLLLGIPFGMALGMQGAMLVEIFPLRSRVMSMSFAYSVTLSLSGAIAPGITLWLLDVVGSATAPAYYVAAYGVFGLAVLIPMKETNARPLDQ
jgi:MHS family proline/betaine transporter-like MFS transporter